MTEVTKSSPKELTLYSEPLDSPGIIPKHLKRAATSDYPLLEIIQRFLVRITPGSGGDLEKVLAIIALYRAVAPAYRHLKEFVLWAFTSQITIPEYDPVAKEVFGWMSSNVISKRLTTNAMLITGEITDVNENMYRQMLARDNGQSAQQSDEAQCLPPIGQRLFWVGFRPYLFSRSGTSRTRNHPSIAANNLVDGDGQLQNAVVLRTLGWSLRPLQDFIKKCHDFRIENKTGTTTVYFSGGRGHDPYTGMVWSSVVKAVRKLDTIDMDDQVKAELVHDAEYYYSEESKRFFADCGIPYRRGYLFHGPPGTGKTSFSAALAGHLSCDIYIINLATGEISDGHLHRLFLALPRKCVVVIEDIDSAGIGREQGLPAEATKQLPTTNGIPNGFPELPSGMHFTPHGHQGQNQRKRNTLTLSGLLNAIDGNASAEGRLLVMTSNNPDILDEALTRPGRIDRKVHFGKMMTPAAVGIFKRLIGRAAVASLGYTDAQIDDYSKTFCSKVPEDTFTPAQIQNYLQACRGDPVKALDGIDNWVADTRSKPPEEAKKEALNSLVPSTPAPNPDGSSPLDGSMDGDGRVFGSWTH